MAVLVVLVALVLLLAFIAWDKRRIAKDTSPTLSRSAAPGRADDRVLGFAAIALVCGIMAASEFVNPRLLPFTGRWAFVYELAYAGGPYGLFIYWALFAAAFAFAALRAWRVPDHRGIWSRPRDRICRRSRAQRIGAKKDEGRNG